MMDNRSSEIRIVFMGTPEFAVASLDALIKTGYPVVGVITAADKPAGRGMKLQESAVKKFAVKKGLNVLQPEKLKNTSFLEDLSSLDADLQIVVAFRMLPEAVWDMPSKGTINLHASLLPQYRGAAPINWAIINGEKETGLTTFKLKHEIDTGDILLQEKIRIGENETAGELHDRMKLLGAELLLKTIDGILKDELKDKPQNVLLAENPGELKLAPKITIETCRIDWNETAEKIHNLIRGLSPYPAAFTDFEGKTLKIYKSRYEKIEHPKSPGTWETDQKSFLRCHCSDGYVYATDVQLEGKKRMPAEDFMRGYRFSSPAGQ